MAARKALSASEAKKPDNGSLTMPAASKSLVRAPAKSNRAPAARRANASPPKPGEVALPPDLVAWGKSKSYAGRIATLVLRTPGPGPDFVKVHAALSDALKADSRVHDFTRPELRADWSRCEPWWPRARDTEPDLLITGDDRFGGVQFSDPFVFKVVEAQANQPPFRGLNTVPTDTYWVAWDGITCCVLWEQALNKGIPRASGRVVVDVIRDAAQRAKLDIYAQACSPGCENIFTHTNVRFVAEGSPHRVTNDREAVFHLQALLPPAEQVTRFHGFVDLTFSVFARTKNFARRIRDLERLARDGLDSLTKTRFLRERARWVPLRQRPKLLWNMRSWRKGQARILADLWVAVSQVEMHKRDWDELRRRFHERASKNKIETLFPLDYSDDETAVDSLDLSLVRSALEDASTRLDSRRLTMATGLTAAAAVAGALLGSVVGH